MKREPILFIRGSEERAEEVRHILEDEWGGHNCWNFRFNCEKTLYYIDFRGIISCFTSDTFPEEALKEGWTKEYILPEKQKFQPFDKEARNE